MTQEADLLESRKIKREEKNNQTLKPTREIKKPYSWGIRNSVQLAFLFITIGVGIHFFIYVLQASGNGAITVSRPPGVEGFLPIGALMGWKLFLVAGIWDNVHPAAMVIFGFAGFISLALRKSFCGWLCPIGTPSEWLWKIGRRIFGKNFRIPVYADYPLRGLKYLILGFFIWTVFSMSWDAIDAFLKSPYYRVSDVKMLFFFTRMSVTTAVVLSILILSSFLVRNPWCRYLCPYGALMGLFALISPTGIKRNPETCIDCKRCSKVCPYHLTVDTRPRIKSPECSGCMDCAEVCPVPKTLELKSAGWRGKAWSPKSLGAVILGLFIVVVYVAGITGHWKSSVSDHEFRVRLQAIDSPKYTHPGGFSR